MARIIRLNEWTVVPKKIMADADFMHRTGSLALVPANVLHRHPRPAGKLIKGPYSPHEPEAAKEETNDNQTERSNDNFKSVEIHGVSPAQPTYCPNLCISRLRRAK